MMFLIVVALLGLFAVAVPLAGVVVAAVPSRASRRVAAAGWVGAGLAAVFLGILMWEEAGRTCPPHAIECGDDSGVLFFMAAPAVWILLANTAAGAAAWVRRPRGTS